MLTRADKQALLEEVTEEAREAKAIVFSDYKGTTVKDLSTIRAELRKSGSRFRVLKKTILDIALRQAGMDVDARKLEGQVGVAFSTDEVVAAKTLADFVRTHKDSSFSIVGGALEGRQLSAEEVGALAKLPTKDELRAKLAGTLQAPIAGFARTLAGTYGGFVRVLSAVADAKK